jgi:hypothetical protein
MRRSAWFRQLSKSGDGVADLDAGFDAIEAKWRARITGQAA